MKGRKKGLEEIEREKVKRNGKRLKIKNNHNYYNNNNNNSNCGLNKILSKDVFLVETNLKNPTRGYNICNVDLGDASKKLQHDRSSFHLTCCDGNVPCTYQWQIY